MSRLLLFVLGIAVGAAGTYFLCWNGNLPLAPVAETTASAPVGDVAEPALPVSTYAPLPATNGPEIASAAAAPASIEAAQVPILPADTLPAPAAGSETEVATAPPTAADVSPANPLLIPVQGVQAAKLTDTFTQSRSGGRVHDAIDIMAARGTPVLAAVDGRVAKLFTSKPGGLTVYQFDGEEKLAYYYAHLDHYAPGLVEGQVLRRGEVLGYVGSTGNASPDAPHLHFAIFVLGPEKRWWQGTAINPYPLLRGR